MMIVCAVLWSIAGIFIKLIPWNPLVIAGARSLLAGAVMALYMRWSGIQPVANRRSLLGGVLIAITFMSFVTANKLTTAANATVLQFTSPVFILLLSAIFLKQRFHKQDVITVAITLAGISLFFFDKLSPGNLLGNLISIFSGVCLGAMFLAVGTATQTERMSGILIGHMLTAIIGLPLYFFTDCPLSGKAIASIFVLGIVQLGIPYVLMGLAMQHCPPLACSLISAIEPLLSPVWVLLFARELPGPFALVGGIIVIAAITNWCIQKDKRVLGE